MAAVQRTVAWAWMEVARRMAVALTRRMAGSSGNKNTFVFSQYTIFVFLYHGHRGHHKKSEWQTREWTSVNNIDLGKVWTQPVDATWQGACRCISLFFCNLSSLAS